MATQMQTEEDRFSLHKTLMSLGASELDAKILLDCVLSSKSCSWVNTDIIEEKAVLALNKFMIDNKYPLLVKVEQVPMRGKFIWEVKAKKMK